MKKDLISISIIFLGVCIIVSSIILSRSKIEQTQSINGSLNASINGSLGVHQSVYDSTGANSGDIISIHVASALLFYDNPDQLKRDIEDGNKDDIPYVLINRNYLFSKNSLEEWVYSKSLMINEKEIVE